MSNKEENVFARFYDRVIKTDKIKENDMPVFEEQLYIEIRIKDDNDVVDRVAEPEDKIRFPEEFARYKNMKEAKQEGTPLNQFSFLTAVQLESCKFRGIETVELLANLSDEQANSLGLIDERTAAKTFLDNAKSFSEKESKFRGEIAELKAENEKLKAEVEELNAEIETLKAAKEDKKTSNK